MAFTAKASTVFWSCRYQCSKNLSSSSLFEVRTKIFSQKYTCFFAEIHTEFYTVKSDSSSSTVKLFLASARSVIRSPPFKRNASDSRPIMMCICYVTKLKKNQSCVMKSNCILSRSDNSATDNSANFKFRQFSQNE